jgi:outer membrane protein assembly factor BamB
MRLLALPLVLTLTLGATPADWPLFDHDSARSGSASDGKLSAATVAGLRTRWRTKLDAVSDSAPIVVEDRLFLTDRDGTTYALESGSGRIVWRFATHGPKITTSVPAYDESTHALYAPGVDGDIHKLDPATGRELHDAGFPHAITYTSQTEKNASPLNVANGYLYAQTSGYIGDAPPYVGYVVAIRLRDGDTHVFNVLCSARHDLIEPKSCDAQRAGMWSRAGVVADPDPEMHGRIYVATGNGPFDAKAGNYGDSILSLSDDARRMLGSLTPSDYDDLESSDRDVGSSSPALLPRQPASRTPLLAVQGGKDGNLKLFDRAKLAGLGAPLQSIPLGEELFSAPAVWTGADGATLVIVGLGDGVRSYRLTTKDGKPELAAAWSASFDSGREGTSPIVYDGIVFVATSGDLIALDARDGKRLWHGDALGPIHWQSPSAAGGAVYCSDENGVLTAFALASSAR